MLIDCDRCAARPSACSDCVVGVLLGTPEVRVRAPRPEEGPADREPAAPGAPLPEGFGPVERRALEVLADHGLIPHLRLVQGGAPDAQAPAGQQAPARPRRSRDAG